LIVKSTGLAELAGVQCSPADDGHHGTDYEESSDWRVRRMAITPTW
jgi:hypothetical protein